MGGGRPEPHRTVEVSWVAAGRRLQGANSGEMRDLIMTFMMHVVRATQLCVLTAVSQCTENAQLLLSFTGRWADSIFVMPRWRFHVCAPLEMRAIRLGSWRAATRWDDRVTTARRASLLFDPCSSRRGECTAETTESTRRRVPVPRVVSHTIHRSTFVIAQLLVRNIVKPFCEKKTTCCPWGLMT